jgi:hypothetical protein
MDINPLYSKYFVLVSITSSAVAFRCLRLPLEQWANLTALIIKRCVAVKICVADPNPAL